MKIKTSLSIAAACLCSLLLFAGCGVNESNYSYGSFSGTSEIPFHASQEDPADALRFRTRVGMGSVVFTLLDADGEELDSYQLDGGKQEIGFELPNGAGAAYTLRLESNLAFNLTIDLYHKGISFDAIEPPPVADVPPVDSPQVKPPFKGE